MEEGRDRQLKIRCWEMAGAWELLCQIDVGEGKLTNFAAEKEGKNEMAGNSGLEGFKGRLDVRTPGKVAWAGHSFGATTVVQFVKSVIYHRDDSRDGSLFVEPGPSHALRQQITANSPTVFLDMWAQPLQSPQRRVLWEKTLPCYITNISNSAPPSSSAPLAILSESFFKWQINLEDTVHVLSPPTATFTPASRNGNATHPHIFYPIHSAHLSQSDFGSLFPWFTKRVFKADEPARTILLNMRAILEVLRRAGLSVADTSAKDMELEDEGKERLVDAERDMGESMKRVSESRFSDSTILDTAEGRIRGWVAIPSSQLDNDACNAAVAKISTMNNKAAAEGMKEMSSGTPDSGYDSPGTTPAEAVLQGEVMKS